MTVSKCCLVRVAKVILVFSLLYLFVYVLVLLLLFRFSKAIIIGFVWVLYVP